jgi:hypothetical protein
MYCAHCGEKINGKPIKQGGEFYCSLECANLASGIEPEEDEEYYEEDEIQSFYEEEGEE